MGDSSGSTISQFSADINEQGRGTDVLTYSRRVRGAAVWVAGLISLGCRRVERSLDSSFAVQTRG